MPIPGVAANRCRHAFLIYQPICVNFSSCQVHLRAFLLFLRTFVRIFSPHPPLSGQISTQNPCKSVKTTVIFHFFRNFYRIYIDTQPPIEYNIYQTMKITIITQKTGITMKPKSTKSKNSPPLAPIYASLFTLHFSCPPQAEKKKPFLCKTNPISGTAGQG